MTHLYQNGRILPLEDAGVSPLDRGFLYGDATYDTLMMVEGKPRFWDDHHARLIQGLGYMRIEARLDRDQLLNAAIELAETNACPECVLRIQVSRGQGPRGYSTRGAGPYSVILTTHPTPWQAGESRSLRRWSLITSSVRVLAGSPWNLHKTANKMPQVMAKIEADEAGVQDALICNEMGRVSEATCANVFVWMGETLCTPPLSEGALPGITRRRVLAEAVAMGVPVCERTFTPEAMRESSGAFLTMTTLGLVEVDLLDDCSLPRHPMTTRLFSILWKDSPSPVSLASLTAG